MKIILIRHGKKDAGNNNDLESPLTQEGRGEVQKLAASLARLNIRPAVYLTSMHSHSEQTARVLMDTLNLPGPDRNEPLPKARIIRLDSFTPRSKKKKGPADLSEERDPLDAILEEVESPELEGGPLQLDGDQLIAFVGHEPRLSQLLTRLTSQRSRPFRHAEAVCLEDGELAQLLKGKARVDHRMPVTANWEDQLAGKIQSKMTVATFLAGFNFAALFELLKDGGNNPLTLIRPEQINWRATLGLFSLFDSLRYLRTWAVLFLTLSLGLFVATVYMYDRLLMPVGFWVDQERRVGGRKRWGHRLYEAVFKLQLPDEFYARLLRFESPDGIYKRFWGEWEASNYKNGPLYSYMVWVWLRVFNVAVFFAFLGFVAVFLDAYNGRRLWIFLLGMLSLLAVREWHRLTRPKLGVD